MKTQSPAAATHKASARTPIIGTPAAEIPVESGAAATPTFDAALHQDEIRIEAYCNWLRNGSPQGSEHSDWLAATGIVRGRYEK